MNFKSLFVGLFAIATLSACSGNDSPTVRATASEDAAVVPADDGSSYEAGTPNITFSKESEKLWVDGAAVDEINSDTFDGYPMLDKNVAALRATSRAVETKENSLELFAGEDLFLAMDLRGDAPALLHAPAGFTAERIVYTKAESEQDQGMMSASVTFDLRECKVEQEEEKEQEQEQEQGKGEEQAPKEEEDKGQDQDQGKGRVIAGNEGEQDQGQDKEQDQGKGEEEKEPAEVCKTSTVTLNLNEIAREQEQEQGKGEEQAPKEEEDKGQDQDQGKGEEQAPKEEEGDKGQDQDQGKDEGQQEEPKEDKGQDQDQGQGDDKDQGQQEEK